MSDWEIIEGKKGDRGEPVMVQDKTQVNKVSFQTSANIPSKYIKKINGKLFVLHAGLLDVAHKSGLQEIRTELVSFENGLAIVKARVVMAHEDNKGQPFVRTFTAHGDAGIIEVIKQGKLIKVSNTNPMVAQHIIRIAETRAINRALRFATNIGMCSVEESGEGALI